MATTKKKRTKPAQRKRRRLPESGPPDLRTMGGRIKELRVRFDLSQSELGRRVGVDRSAVAQWELGYTANIKNETLIKLCRLFDVTYEYLVLGLPPEKPEKRGSR